MCGPKYICSRSRSLSSKSNRRYVCMLERDKIDEWMLRIKELPRRTQRTLKNNTPKLLTVVMNPLHFYREEDDEQQILLLNII